MADQLPFADDPVEDRTYDEVAARAAQCRNCDLWEHATGTVFGEGPVPAEVMVVGEQPGDQEDRRGRPFVGPAGQVLDEGLAAAGFDRSTLYVTNAVKHFKWTARGKRRLHQKPDRTEVLACRPWLDAELDLVQPRLLVLMGATAAQGILGPSFRVTASRGRPLESAVAPIVLATIHPSAILRADRDARPREMAAFVADLEAARRLLAGASG